ncbi:MAG: hypothetical protein HY566_01725 [Candidatus Kerfeldbacteria bacterium]|nr:hypothetical protein [Candidatus Kerfeldbacteria bacterium]
MKEKHVQVFTPLDIRRTVGGSKIAVNFLVHRWKESGKIISLKRGLYALPSAHIPEPYIANKLYEPSYVSLEFALSYHRVIPETVYAITSVTTRATRQFETTGKVFTYRSIKKAAFTGYTTAQRGGFSFNIADPEKAFVDTNYYRYLAGKAPLHRFDKEKVRTQRAVRYARLFAQPRFVSIVISTLR